MSKTVQLKRGNTAQNSTYTGAQGEVTVNTTNYTLVVHDGVTAGGYVVPNYSNTNVAAYLITSTGNISAGNLNVIGNIVDTGALSIITGSNGNIALIPNGTGIVTASGAFTAVGNITGGNISAGNVTANSISVTSVVQFANLTTTQINAITPISRGMTVFNFTTGNIQVYNGTKWANITLS